MLSGTGSGGGAGIRNANTWGSRHRIRLVHDILTSNSATIHFQPESLSSCWSTSKILRASDIRLDACGVSKVHLHFSREQNKVKAPMGKYRLILSAGIMLEESAERWKKLNSSPIFYLKRGDIIII